MKAEHALLCTFFCMTLVSMRLRSITFHTNLTANRQQSDESRSTRRNTNSGTLGAIAGVSPVRCCVRCVAGVVFLQVEPQSGIKKQNLRGSMVYQAFAPMQNGSAGSSVVLFYLWDETFGSESQRFRPKDLESSALPEAKPV